MSGAPNLFSPNRFLGVIVLGMVACAQVDSEGSRVFHLEQMRPRPSARSGVFLNEALVFHFSAEVDPDSVTRASLAVRTIEGGEAATGRFEIDGNRVRFLPDLGLARDLSDGGLKPGKRYEVTIRGFPAPDGLRSSSGLPLAQSSRFYFDTATMTDPPGQMFEDRSPDRGFGLVLVTESMRQEQSLFLVCEEPVDPSTLVDGEFVFQSAARPSEEPIPLDPVLRLNSHLEGARLELRPRRRLGPGPYRLPGNLRVTVRDFGGNMLWFPASAAHWDAVQVSESGAPLPVWVESFLSSRMRSPLVIPGVDGSASWTGDGSVRIRYPAAAGSGRDGHVLLSGMEPRADVHAIHLEMSEGTEVALRPSAGLVVIRAQGSLRLNGRLTRKSGGAPGMEFKPRERLTDWLARAIREDYGWTVVVAGGDLVIDGDIEVDGPLLLVAGGRIRITGRVRAQDRELWLVGSPLSSGLHPSASLADLVLDPPRDNPLVEPLTFAVLSGPLPPAGGVLRWGMAEVAADPRNGEFKVEYLPGAVDVGLPMARWGLVSSPRDLLSAPSLRLLLSLTVKPADSRSRVRLLWDPPVIDDVRLQWEPGDR